MAVLLSMRVLVGSCVLVSSCVLMSVGVSGTRCLMRISGTRCFVGVFGARRLLSILTSLLTSLLTSTLLLSAASLLSTSSSGRVLSLSVGGGRAEVASFGAQFSLLVVGVEVGGAETVAIPVEAAGNDGVG